MALFVTGGNGFIGSRVVAAARARGDEVRCLLRASSNTSRIEGLGYQRHLGDVTDRASLVEGMRGCEGVIHLASISSWSQIRSPKMREVVVGGTENVLAAAREAGGLRVVFVSSGTAIQGTKDPRVLDERAAWDMDREVFLYAAAKHDAEQICACYAAEGLPVVTVNPCEVYGPQDEELITAANLIDILKGWPALAVEGGTAVAHVDDVAAGILAALDRGRPGERYILGGENLSVRQLVELTLEIGGQKKWVLQLPNGVVKGAVGALAKLGLPTPVIPDVLDYACLYWWVDSAKAQRELGYRYRPPREVLEPTIAWLRERGRV